MKEALLSSQIQGEKGGFFMFTKEYWMSSVSKLKSTKYLTIMALTIALRCVIGNLYIPVSENLHLSVTFLIVAVEAIIVGPVAGMVCGAVADIVGFMLVPAGTFFPGYTLTAMAGDLTYALFLYRQKITLPRIIGAKLVTNYIVNVLMGSLWSSILYSKGYYYYFTKSLVKNTLYLPFQIVMLVVVLKAVMPILRKRRLVE